MSPNEGSYQDKRKFTRIPFDIGVSLAAGDSAIQTSRLKNISLEGMFVLTNAKWKIGTECIGALEITGKSTRLTIQVKAEVIRIEKDGLAMKFTEMDLDSLLHLRHLIAIHSENPDQLDKEYFAEWIDVE